jgi:hypothetical protein
MMGNIIACCMILNNMIIEDEYEGEDCDNDYLFEDDDTFTVDPAEHANLADSCLFSNHLSTVQSHYVPNKTHFSLKQDLIEHLWNAYGSRRRA